MPADCFLLRSTPFQSQVWLEAWYTTLGQQPNIIPAPCIVHDRETAAPLLLLPLIIRRAGTVSSVEFADLGVSDYNAPLVLQPVTWSPNNTRSLMEVLRSAFRGKADRLYFKKMSGDLKFGMNPLCLHPKVQRSLLAGNIVTMTGSWSDYRAALSKRFRKELERSDRVFQRLGHCARFIRLQQPDQVLDALERMETLQARRMRELGRPYILNQTPYQAFYRRLVHSGLASEELVVTALYSEPHEWVAILFGLQSQGCLAMIRLGQNTHSWSKCSPGKLVIFHTMRLMHEQGIGCFDFTTGSYAYKKGFLVREKPLYELTLPVSFKGHCGQWYADGLHGVKRGLQRYPLLFGYMKKSRERIRCLFGRTSGTSSSLKKL